MKRNAVEIEYINALAPFDHGIWEASSLGGSEIKVGVGSLFSERSIWLVEKIVSYLTNKFSLAELETMSVLEVGSYDGWVLTQICKKIRFANVIGIEARSKNIRKGEVGRQLADVVTQAKFIKGNANDISNIFSDQYFNIVLCLGMLHHVSSTYDVISALCNRSKDIVIIDSMIIPELQADTQTIEPYVNTKDIVYYGEDKTWSIAAFKFESPYGDGSRPNFGIVNVPSARLIEMSLSSSGFGRRTALGSEQDFYSSSKQNLRGVKELLLVAERDKDRTSIDSQWTEKIDVVENIFCHISLPDVFVLALAETLFNTNELGIKQELEATTSISKDKHVEELVRILVVDGLSESLKAKLFSSINDLKTAHVEIASVIFRSPFEKIIFEISKFFLEKDHPLLAIKYLQLVVSRPGCDWWVFYRSCYLLRKSFKLIGDEKSSQRYSDLLSLSNENFPF
jgi:2-polyprenyl-3-methyl-5-hydroxy-6-metoxy-1,4-benzoquinol methylase